MVDQKNKLTLRLIAAMARCSSRLLYILSDMVFLILMYVVRYRKNIIQENLQKAFPDFSKEKIRSIRGLFYRNLSDYLFETLSYAYLPAEQLQKRIEYKGLELLEKHHSEKKNVFLLVGHLFNWECFISLIPKLPQKKTYAIYKPIGASCINKLMNSIRSRFGTTNLSIAQSARAIMQLPNNGEHIFLILGDQSPQKNKIYYSLSFLNQQTAAYNGFDKMARKKDIRIVYGQITKVERGRYSIHFLPIKAQEEKFRENEIAEKFFALLESNIENQPDNWLWSHRRWKHKKGIDF